MRVGLLLSCTLLGCNAEVEGLLDPCAADCDLDGGPTDAAAADAEGTPPPWTFEWTRAEPTSERPAGRRGAAMGYDPRRAQVLMYGGVGGEASLLLGDTWGWDGSSWSLVAAQGPPPRVGAAMAFDRARDRLVVFGGSGDGNCRPHIGRGCGDTWSWDGATWAQVSTDGPGGRVDTQMVYDPTRQEIVLFGGQLDANSPIRLKDTWVWDGREWFSHGESAEPLEHAGHRLSYDDVRQRVFMIGGVGSSGRVGWTWDGAGWTRDGMSPFTRRENALAYDDALGASVLFGGLDGNEAQQDTWAWDGTNWAHIASTGPSPRSGAAMAYDEARGELVLFGGDSPECAATRCNDTWIGRLKR